MSSKAPLLLLHGVTMSSAAWDEVVPLLADDFDVIVPTLPGHRGGPKMPDASFEDLVDFVEEILDGRGFETVHLAGNSLGGWIALELARRGRARSVCGLSPAGFWPEGRPDATGVVTALRRTRRLAQLTSFLAPVVVATGPARKKAMELVAEHGDRMSSQQALGALRDMVGCEAASSLFRGTGYCAPMDSAPMPGDAGVVGQRPHLPARPLRPRRAGAASRRALHRARRPRARADDRRSGRHRCGDSRVDSHPAGMIRVVGKPRP